MTEPIHIISLGAGVQSSAMALMAAAGEILPMPTCAIFADTQAEPKAVYEWLDWLEQQLPYPVHRVTAGELAADQMEVKISGKTGKPYLKNLIPAFVDSGGGILGRKCTGDYKVTPLQRKVREITGVKRQGEGIIRAIVWIGISSDEVHRMKPSRVDYIKQIWPLIEKRISRHRCLQWMKEKGFPVPPRSACVFCPFHSDNEWRRLRDTEPEEFEKAIAFEKAVHAAHANQTTLVSKPFLHRSCVPLDQVDFSTDEDHGQQVMFGNECEGMCGV